MIRLFLIYFPRSLSFHLTFLSLQAIVLSHLLSFFPTVHLFTIFHQLHSILTHFFLNSDPFPPLFPRLTSNSLMSFTFYHPECSLLLYFASQSHIWPINNIAITFLKLKLISFPRFYPMQLISRKGQAGGNILGSAFLSG